MVNVKDNIEQSRLIKGLRELEETPGVDFVDPVIGPKDVVVMVGAPVIVESIAEKIRHDFWIKDTEILRIVGMLESPAARRSRVKID